MSIGIESYTNCIKVILESVLCLSELPSEIVEKDNKPYIEMYGYNNQTNNLVFNPIYISRSKEEKCLIEPSVNSVRLSFCIRKLDETDTFIIDRYSQYMKVRADMFKILRREPVKGYDLSFLIQANDLNNFRKENLIDFFVNLLSEMEKEIKQIKLYIQWNLRGAAKHFLNVAGGNVQGL